MIGKKLGKYQIKGLIGWGGMGVVYKVWDTLEEKFKCIKTFPPQIAGDKLSLKALKKEALNASKVKHPNVVNVLSFEEKEGIHYIVMEFVEGETAADKMARDKNNTLPEQEVLNIMKNVAMGLLEAHKNGVIHCDLKPQNIMIINDRDIKVVDFSVSYQMTKSMTLLTNEQLPSGTLPYMAPEQLSKKFGRISEQTDVWGYGATMYHMLCGEVPFDNREQIIDPEERPFELEGVSERTKKLVMKCLEKDNKNRFKSIAEILDYLQDFDDMMAFNEKIEHQKDGLPSIEKVIQDGIDLLPISIGLEVLGGIFHRILEKGIHLPARKEDIFTTAEDNQSSVEIQVFAGEHDLSKYNKALGKFTITGIPLSPRGVPQIGVVFEVDKNGVLNVSATDYATNKKQEIIINSATQLSERDITQMIKGAQEHEEEVKKERVAIEEKNKLDQFVYTTEKMVAEHKEKISEEILTQVYNSLKRSKEAIKINNHNMIQIEFKNLERLAQIVSTELYKKH